MNTYKRHFIFHIFLLLFSWPTLASPVDKAFNLTLTSKPPHIIAQWTFAPGNYLYQSKIAFKSSNTSVTLTPLPFPKGETHNDPDLGSQIIYKNKVSLMVKIANLTPKLTDFPLSVHYQGCSEQGFCYPPQVKYFKAHIQKGVITDIQPIQSSEMALKESVIQTDPLPATLPFFNIPFNTQNIFTLFFACFALGVVLCFTPCVLPMVPMLSTLIIGKKHLKTKKAFALSSVYVLSMSLTYALAGMSAALLGQRIQTAFQSPLVLSLFAGLFFVLGLELSGHLKISMPDFIKSRLYNLQTKSHSGTFLGAMALGVLATLVASPCVSAPLMGILGYITQTGNVMVGGLSLFAIGLGMGAPLIIAGTLGGKYLPKSGRWMQLINEAFAITLFGFAIWILDRFLAPIVIMPLWALLCLYVAYKMGTFNLKRSGFMPRLGMLFVVTAGFFVLSLLPHYGISLTDKASLPLHVFHPISSLKGLEEKLNQAKKQDQPTLVEFYADWCASCKKIDKHTFSDPSVQAYLKDWYLIKANVTQNTLNEQLLLKQFDLLGPPSILFFDKKGIEQPDLRLSGEVSADVLIEHLKKLEAK